MTDEPISPRYVQQMRGLAEVLDRQFNGDRRGNARQIGFVLLIFPFGPKPINGHQDDDKHRTNYISNATRADVIAMLREQLAYFEGKETVQ